MARNPLKPGPGDAAPAPRSTRVLPVMLVAGAALAVGVPWLATMIGGPGTRPATTIQPLPTLPVRPSDDTVLVTPAAAPAAPATPFLDPSGAGGVSYAAGDYQGALAQYRAAVERNPEDAESHSNLGQVLVRLKQPEEALPHFTRAIEIIPDRWAYHFNRARAHGLLQRWDEAISGYRQAQLLFPDDYATAFNLAQALHRRGDEESAVEQYLRAIALNPEDGTFRLALGISYEALGRKSDAAAAYGEYLRLLPDAADADTIRARIARLTAS